MEKEVSPYTSRSLAEFHPNHCYRKSKMIIDVYEFEYLDLDALEESEACACKASDDNPYN
jgi:hypothetical protein